MKSLMVLLIILATYVSPQAISAQIVNLSAFDTTMYGRNDKAGHFTGIRGFKMYYETYGTGKPLLIIHGNGRSIRDFVYQIPYFSEDYKVILADSRAQGKSVDQGDSLSYEMMADDISALLDNLHLDSCYVIGWSDGGINGLLLAIRHPDKVKKLAVTGANLWPDTTAVDPYIYRWARRMNDSLDKLPQTTEVRNVKKVTHLLTYQPHISIDDLKRIKCPVLVIGGDYDVIVPGHTLLIAESIPKSYLWILPRSGHSTLINYKDLFNEVVHDFFSRPYIKIEGLRRLD